MGPILGDDHLKALGFRLKEDKKQRSAYFGHRWYQAPLIRGLPAFAQALGETQKVVDEHCSHSP
jgi:hypothetical protein